MKRPIKKERRRQRRNTRTWKIVSAVIAVVLVVAMAVGLLPGNTGKVYAAEPVADGQTMLDYRWSLGDANSTLYNGRVWTDKSVSTTDVTFSGDAGNSVTVPIGTGEDASDFLVTYSALATSQQVSGESSVPIDVVFVIDLSGSMSNDESYMNNRQKRIQNLVTALNASINELMDMNPENRIGVVGYSTSATTILPLDHYTPWNNYGQDNIFSYNESGGWDPSYTLSWNARNSSNQRVNDSISVTGGTNIHMGVDAGMDMLLDVEDTTVTINGIEMQRVPSLILLSDGSPTYSGADSQGYRNDYVSWWDPSGRTGTGYSAGQGGGYDQGDAAYEKFAMKTIMNAAYNKERVNEHYDVSDNYAMKVYTVGIGLDDLEDSTDLNAARLSLNPDQYLTANNTISRAVNQQWTNYINNRTARLDGYTFQHPTDGDITSVSYNDAYYDAITAEDINTIFDDIVSSISINTPQVPTKVSGDDPVHDGYITYTDVIGDYMEVDSVKTLIWAGNRFDNPRVSGEGTDEVTYTFSGEINNPAYENAQNADQIQITVHTDTSEDGTKTQTMTVKIPATAIPLRVNTIELNDDGTVKSNTSNNAYPLRLVYGVSLQDDIDPETLEGVSDEYIEANTENGMVNFYSNKYSGNKQGETTVGDAKVEFTPADNNPFYFIQEDTPIYTSQDGGDRVREEEFDPDSTYWVPITYYNAGQIVNTRVERSGSSMADYINYERDGEEWWSPSYAYIEAGAPRLGNIEQFIREKEPNSTGTAETSSYPTFEGDVHNGKFVIYLGNNGKLQLDAPASLTIEKNVTATEGLSAPDKEFAFDVTIPDKANMENVKAIIHTADAEDQEVTLKFDDNGKAQVVGADGAISDIVLKAGQSLEIPGMGNTEYSVKEKNASNNAGFNLTNVEGATGEGAENSVDSATAAGTVGTDDATVTFTNTYSVTPVTSENLHITLGGSKTITGRDFQQDDTFTFTIAAAQAAPNAPLPQKDGQDVTNVTINPTSGTSENFEFDGVITFTKPGEYRYIITEVNPNDDSDDQTTGLGGIDYDSSVYRVNIVIVDNGDGTLRLATTEEIENMTTQGDLEYTANPMVQVYNGSTMVEAPDNTVTFENKYSADSTTATIQGTKVLDVTNSDYTLEDGDFNFQIRALGSTTETKDSYTESDFTDDEDQPMPVDQEGEPLDETGNIANGNVQFSFGEGVFTQEMVGKTFGYEITESRANAPSNTTMDSNISRIVWVTVSDDGDGNVVATVQPNNAQQGQRANNFTFTNSYEPTSITIGDGASAGITVQKTFKDHAWTDDYSFEFTIKSISAPDGVTPPMPENEKITIENPASGNSNTNMFGEMTFEQEGTYTYEISETNGSHGGVTYDYHTATVTVTVSEDENTGTLSAKVSYDNSNALNDADKAVENAAAFTNTYSATFDTDTTVNLDGTKNLTVGGNSDRTLGAGQFFFVVTPLDGAPYGDKVINDGASSYTVENAADDKAENGTFSGAISGLLSNVTYDLSDLDGASSKDFVYLISEQQSGSQGVTYDSAVYQVTITVTDDGEGKLSAGNPQIVKGTMQDDEFVADESQDGVEGVVFNNSYTPNSQTITAQTLKKVLSGDRKDGLEIGEFEFKIELTEGDQSGVTLPNPATITNAADGTVQFGNITFTKVGTYKIKVTEVIPEEAVANDDGSYTLNGITYDTHTVETTFQVTDNNGQLAVNRTGTAGSTTFTNKYDTTGTLNGETALEVEKVLEGRDWQKDDTFTFTLESANDTTTEAITNGSVTLPENATGITIAYDEENPTADKTEAFGDITFTEPGVYTFVIKEKPESIGGISYDGSSKYVIVTAEDQNDGTLNINYDVKTGTDENAETTDLEFTNTYAPGQTSLTGSDNLKVTKTFTGRPNDEWLDTDSFEFTLAIDATDEETDAAYRNGDIVLPENTTLTVNAQNNGSASFGDITFKKAGTYQFIVTETDGGLAGVKYDTTPRTVIVNVVDNHDGTMTASLDEKSDELSFANTYDNGGASLSGDTALKVTKSFTGRPNNEWLDSDQFTFELSVDPDDETTAEAVESGAVVLPEDTTTTATKDQQTASFDKIKFTEEGTYKFVISEKNDGIAGVDYDTSIKHVTVVVTDNDNGTMSTEVTIDNQVTSSTSFTNEYKPEKANLSGDQNLKVVKVLEGRGWQEGDEFTFTLKTGDEDTETAVNDGIVILPSSTVITIDKKTPGFTKAFEDITFTEEGTYTFTITESGDVAGIVNDSDAERTIIVNVVDNDDGTLTATVDADKSEGLTFTNVYNPNEVTIGPDTDDGIKVQKTLTGRDWTEDEEYTFTITNKSAPEGIAEGDIPMPDTASINIGKPANGNVNTAMFGEMKFTQAGTYVYEISEQQSGDSTGMIYDSHVATVTVAVFEAQHDIKGPDGEVIHAAGTLWTQVQYDNSSAGIGSDGTEDNHFGSKDDQNVTDAAAFTNIQNVEGTIDLTGTKILEGRNFQEGDAFTFHVEAEDGAPMPDKVDDKGNITIKPTESNEAKISFGQIKFTEVGEYIYRITEKAGDAEGMTYDTARRDLIITVTNDGQGSLKAEITVGSDQLTWTNSWTFQPGDPVSLDGTKTLTGKELEKEQFTFNVEPQDGAPMGDTLPANYNGVAKQNEDGSWTAPITLLNNITYTAPGEYVYLITEVDDGQPGITYDDSQYRVTVQVAQDGTTTTKVEKSKGNDTWVEIPDGSIAFNNSYATEGEAVLDGSANLAGTKTLTGRDWINTDSYKDSFTFILAAGDDATKAAVEAGEVKLPEPMVAVQGGFSEGTAVPFNFGDISFTEAGDYTFTISEQQPDEEGAVSAIPGITYDDHVRTIKVHVADNGRGKLTAEVVADGTEGDTNWTNVYTAKPTEPVNPGESSGEGTGNVRLTKVLEGKSWGENDEFTFEITAKDEASKAYMPANTKVTVSDPDGKNADGNDIAYINFDEITFDKEGTFTYEVREIKGDNPGMTYSSNVATITINVSDNLQGGYTAVVNISNSTFTNVYSTEVDYDAHAAINLTKVLSGHDMEAGQFKFDVKPDNQESADKLGIDPNGLTLNSPAAAKGDKAVMSLLGRNNVTFTQKDAGKTYSYTISELDADNAPEGYKYDGDVYTLTIKVSDDGDGTLSVVTTVSNGEDYTMSETVTNRSEGVTTMEVPFTNTYNATGTLGGDGEGAVKINAIKELTNRDQVAGEFKFNVTNSKEENGEPVATGTNAADGTVTFDLIEYTTEGMLEDVANGIAVAGKTEDGNDTYTYQYTVAEDESSFDDGVTAIEASFQITVTVTDNNDGTLSIAVTYPEGSNDNLTFRNAYGAGEDGTAVLNIKGAKDLDVESGNNAPDIAGKYTFELSGSEGAPMPDNTTATNDAAGNVSFGDITYTMENVFGEAASDDSSVSEDQTAEPETPAADEAVDGNEGGSAEDTADVPADETDGTEAETADETGSAEAEVDAQSADEAVQPEAEQQDAGVATGDSVQTTSVEPAMTGNDGIAALSTVRQKTFTYTVTETGNVAGVTNDAEASKTFDVTVTDNGDGTLSVTTSEVPGGLFKFTNTYSVTPTDPTDPTNPDDSGEAAVTITKELAGRDMTEGEFSFVLKDANGETVSETKNAADGSVKFTGITFDTPGSYSYTISEVQGNAGGVTYDSTIYKATATVTDNSDGTLYAVWSVTDADGNAVDSIVFHNEYSYSGTTTVTLGATKALDGRAMEEGEFNFLLKDSDGETVAKAANSKDGAVQFDELSFDKPGTYEYTISEEKGDDATITYDDTVYNVTVTVADSGEGYLTASVDFGGETPAFTNVYTAPEEPTEEPAKPADNSNKGETPKTDKIQKEEPAKTTTVQTGDSSPIMMTVIVMAAALVAIIAAIVVMFRRRNGR